ncbi:Dihydroorotase [Morganella morganii]|nr:Dihydroorotase [Morganella morganii]
MLDGDDNVAATLTPQHLMFNRNHMLVGGVRPHLFCLPILKRNVHQEALRQAVAGGCKRFFLGTDSAPHAPSPQRVLLRLCRGVQCPHRAGRVCHSI